MKQHSPNLNIIITIYPCIYLYIQQVMHGLAQHVIGLFFFFSLGTWIEETLYIIESFVAHDALHLYSFK